jgi:PDZ domain-containing protein
LIKVSGARTYPSKGKLLLTTASVSDHALTVWEYLWALVDPNVGTIPRKYLVPPGVSDAEQNARNLRDMEQSKLAAEAAAFRALGKPVVTINGARVVSIDTQQIGGPSGGLVFALSIYDAFTPADFTHGHVIAVSGTIDADGAVGAIGAIEEKIRGARAARADVFIAPNDQGEAGVARLLAPPGMRVIGVATLQEAIAALRGLPQTLS